LLRSDLQRRKNRRAEALADARRAVGLVEAAVVEGSGYLFELGANQTAYRHLAETLEVRENDAPPDLETCLVTLKKAVSAGFDDSVRLRHDPRLKLLRDRLKSEFEQLVTSAQKR
jgi:hypothetical protein